MRTYTKLDWLVMFAIFMFPVTFLTVRHGVHVSLFALLLITFYQFWRVGLKKIQLLYPQDLLTLFIFSGLFISILISQTFRGAIHFAALDGPSRVLFAGIIFIFLKELNIPYIKILRIAIPAGLILIFSIIVVKPLDPYWSGRFSMYFVDPNTLGSQVFILTLLSIVMIGWNQNQSSSLLGVQVLGCLMGFYVAFGSGSRGAWLATPFIFALFIFLKAGDIAHATNLQRKKLWYQLCTITLLIFSLFFVRVFFLKSFSAN
ncbi:hypothetical protein [Polynucleobacter duraquae]|nr:hypothetical protein [Polynucleobacter duraquae]